MTTLDWKALKPHVPLGPSDAQYIERVGSAGHEIVNWIRADRSPLLVGGPAGVGKSTELARAAALLQQDRVACLVQLDRFENMRRVTPERMLYRLVQRVGWIAREVLHLKLSGELVEQLTYLDTLMAGAPIPSRASAHTLLGAVISETERLSRQGRVTLLIDGLEKVANEEAGRELFDALTTIRDSVELVVVIPWYAAFGPQAESVLRAGERLVSARALEVEGSEGEEGREFLRSLLVRRLNLPNESLDPHAIVRTVDPTGVESARNGRAAIRAVVDDAIRWSGGLPRVFLQLMADAASYAQLRGRGPWPDAEDMSDACADQVDSYRRLLLPGDAEAIRKAAGTSGMELQLDPKVRLMAHGVLLERIRGGRPVLEAHPLVQATIGRGPENA